MSGPRKIIELDESVDSARVETGAVHLWKDKLWRLEAVGCVLCVEDEDSVTLSEVDDEGKCHCSIHGELAEVPYVMAKTWTVRIGDVQEEGSDRVEDSMLFPVSMSTEERDVLVRKYLEDAKAEMANDADDAEPEEG